MKARIIITYAIDPGFWKGYIHQSNTILHTFNVDIPAPEPGWCIYNIAIYQPEGGDAQQTTRTDTFCHDS